MKLDPGIHIAMHSVLSSKPGVITGPQAPNTQFRNHNTMKVPQSNASQVTTNNNNARACFNCRETGHYIANCPYAKNKPAASAFSNTVNEPRPPVSGANCVPIGSNNKGNNNSQQPYGRARVNHINAQAAQGAQGVLLGEFLVS